MDKKDVVKMHNLPKKKDTHTKEKDIAGKGNFRWFSISWTRGWLN